MNLAEVKSVTIPEGKVSRILSGDRVLWSSRQLPSAYQQVEYIQSYGYEYIDTGVIPSDYPGGIDYYFKGTQTGGANNYIFGCLDGGVRSGNLRLYFRTSVMLFSGANSNIIKILDGNYFDLNEILEVTIRNLTSESTEKLSAELNGIPLTDSGSFSSAAMPGESIYLFTARGTSEAAGTDSRFRGRVYEFTMNSSADGTAIRSFIPCYRISDSVIGLYDTVGGVFYENTGTGSFTKGGDV